MVPGTPITQRRLGFDDDEGSDTGTRTGGYVGGSTSADKDYGKAGTPCLERLIQSEGASDSPIISWFGGVYMLDSTAPFFKEMGTETPQHFSPIPLIDSAATVRSDLKTYAEKCMFDVFVHCCCLYYVRSEDNFDAMRAVTEVCKQIPALSQKFRYPKNWHWFILTTDQLYDQYLELIPNTSSDTTNWAIHLSS